MPLTGDHSSALQVVGIGGVGGGGESYPSGAAAAAAAGATSAAVAAVAGAGVTPEGGKLASGGRCRWGCGVESRGAAVVDEVVCGHEAEEERERGEK